jgi:hypothetical protein
MRVRDISQGGLKMECAAVLATGANIVISLPGIEPQPSVVRWLQAGFTGITFNRLLALPVLVAWLEGRRSAIRAAG